MLYRVDPVDCPALNRFTSCGLQYRGFNDKLEYKNIENKSEGYDIIDGDFNKVIQFRRSKNTIEWSKKKGH